MKDTRRHTKKPRLLILSVLAVTILSTLFGSFSSIVFAAETETIAQEHADDSDWLIKSYIYYTTISFCFNSTHLRDFAVGKGYYIDQGHALTSQEWFAPVTGSKIDTGWYFSPSSGSAVTDGQTATSCSSDTLIKKALSHWGISGNGISKLLLGMGFEKDSDGFNEGDLSKAELSSSFKAYIQTNVYGDTQTPTLSDKEKYIFWAYSLKNSGILPSIISKAPDNTKKAANGSYQSVKWIDISSLDTETFRYSEGTYSDQNIETNSNLDNFMFGEAIVGEAWANKSIKYAVSQINTAATTVINSQVAAATTDKYSYIRTGDDIGKIQATGGFWGDAGILFADGYGSYSDITQEFKHIFYASKDFLLVGVYANTCKADFNIYSENGTEYYLSLNANTEACDSHQLAAISTSLSLTDNKKLVGINDIEYADPNDEDDVVEEAKSCGSQVTGLGWILCPIVDGLTKLNDGVWYIAEKLLTVSPLEQSGSDNIYSAWKTIRDLANVAFVIVFLITIFSQITSLGISNYGIKKLLPKLIVCAILVNVSYVLAQVVVDLANIVGSSLYKTIIGMSSTVMPTWGGALSAILLAKATSATIAGVVISGLISPGAAIWLLVPMALTGLLGVLAAMLTLAFRQAAIPILVIMAPLAIVARLMPGTEGLFKKWLGLVKPMLLLYPLAALIFGGARFAAGAINDENNWFSQIIALVILALPLFSLPFLARNSGAITNAVNGALGKFKDKGKAPLKSWGKEHADLSNSKYGAGTAAAGARGVFRRGYQASTYRKMTRKMQTATNNTNIESAWGLTDQGVNAIGNSTSAGVLSKDVKTQADTAWQGRAEATTLQSNAKNNEIINTQIKSDVQGAVEAAVPVTIRMDAKVAEDNLKNVTNDITNQLKEASTQQELDKAMAANPTDITIPIRRKLVETQETANIIATQGNSADKVIRQEYLEKLSKGGEYAFDAGGIDKYGAIRAEASAIGEMGKVAGENLANIKSTIKIKGLDNKDLLEALSDNHFANDTTPLSNEQRMAISHLIVESNDDEAILNLYDWTQKQGIDDPGTSRNDFQMELADLMAKSDHRPTVMGGGQLGKLRTGTLTETYGQMFHGTVTGGKFSKGVIQKTSDKELTKMATQIKDNIVNVNAVDANGNSAKEHYIKLAQSIVDAKADPMVILKDNQITAANELLSELTRKGIPIPPPSSNLTKPNTNNTQPEAPPRLVDSHGNVLLR